MLVLAVLTEDCEVRLTSNIVRVVKARTGLVEEVNSSNADANDTTR